MLRGWRLAASIHQNSARTFDLTKGAARCALAPKQPVIEQRVVQGWEELGLVDPFALVKEELDTVTERLRRTTVVTDIPALQHAASYFYQVGVEGKRFRPAIVLLMASSLSNGAPAREQLSVDERPPNVTVPELRRRQQRLAEITDLIHVASLLHDDVIDDAETRRSLPALNMVQGNKVAILAGDYLLARASVTLAALRTPEVIVLMSQIIEHLVSGEILQLTSTPDQLLSMEYYLKKTHYKTASLMANSCRATAVLDGAPTDVCQLAWDYGRHLGLAFQIVDDILDFTASSDLLGKPALNDIKSGIATAPVLFAAEEHPELVPLIRRKFRGDGDAAAATALVLRSNGIARARQMAATHAGLATDAVGKLPAPASAHAETCRQALLNITERVLNRAK